MVLKLSRNARGLGNARWTGGGWCKCDELNMKVKSAVQGERCCSRLVVHVTGLRTKRVTKGWERGWE